MYLQQRKPSLTRTKVRRERRKQPTTPKANAINPRNHQQLRAFLDEVRKKSNGSLDALYSFQKNEALKLSQKTSLLVYYDQSIALAIMVCYPEHHWQPWRFTRSLRGWWFELSRLFSTTDDAVAEAVVREYMDEFAQMFSIKKQEDWRAIAARKTGRWLDYKLSQMGSLQFVLQKLYPNAEWLKKEAKRESHSEGSDLDEPGFIDPTYWLSPQNRRQFLDKMVLRYGRESNALESLYGITFKTFEENNALGMLVVSQKSTIISVVREYPEHAWCMWKFATAPRRWVCDLGRLFKEHDPIAEINVREWFEDISEKHQLRTAEDWLLIGSEKLGSSTMRVIYELGGLSTILRRLFPELWENDLPTIGAQSAKPVTQYTLYRVVESVLPINVQNLNSDEI